jgi:hypothetical protein
VAVVRGLDSLGGLARPVALASERLLPVLGPLAPLLPDGGLRRGSVVSVSGSISPPMSLALALLAEASRAGSWCAAVGVPSLGLAAAAELGIVLERFPLVASSAGADEWAWAVAALLDAVDVVLSRPPGHVGAARARRLAARTRERSAVLVVTGAWPEPADVRLAVTHSAWEGVGDGHGCLRARRVEVVASGRGAAGRERRMALWLPGPDGAVAPAGTTADADVADADVAVATHRHAIEAAG